MFVDREQELAFLERVKGSSRAEFIVVYGRRRVGKTALLRTFCTDQPHTFWVASLSSEALLRQDFTQTLWQTTHPENPEPGFIYETWERAFQAMAELATQRRHIVVIDEFPYLVNADPSIPSVLQKVWDAQLQHTQLMFILCGSHIGMMEQEVLVYRAPLYGRRTGQIHLRPLPIRASAAFFPHYSTEQRIQAYAILGGTPAYLAHFDDQVAMLTNIEQKILDPGSYLYMEPQFLLREELREPRNYFAILQAIAQGRTRLNEIAQITGLGRQTVSRYLAILQDLRLVERRVPVTEKHPDKSRKGIYRVCDPFLRFWFRFVAPHYSSLERGQVIPVVQRVAAELPTFTGPVFEDLCRDWVVEQGSLGRLPFTPKQVGAWWERDTEIDIMAVGEGAVLLGECKWTSQPMGTRVLDDLKHKAYALIQQEKWCNAHYALFSRSGFTSALEARAQAEGVLLVGLEDLLASLEQDAHLSPRNRR